MIELVGSKFQSPQHGSAKRSWFWLALQGFFAILFGLAFGSMAIHSVWGEAPSWNTLTEGLLIHILGSSAILAAGAFVGTSIVGLSLAIWVAATPNRGKRFFDLLFILPLAVPPYVFAYSYAELVGYGGWLDTWFGTTLDIKNIWGAIFVFTFTLFPYVYLPCRIFLAQKSHWYEVGSSLGLSRYQSQWRLIRPMVLPVAMGGALLAVMEVLNDFGVCKYFGIPTLTVGIMKIWTGYGDYVSAVRLALILMTLVAVILILQPSQKGNDQRLDRTDAKAGKYNALGALFASLVALLSLLLPLSIMIKGVWATGSRVFDHSFALAAWHSCSLACLSAAIAVMVAFAIEFGLRHFPSFLGRRSKSIVLLCYSTPGIIIALGLLLPIVGLDRWMIKNQWTTAVISQSLVLPVLALVIRYTSVAVKSAESGYATVGKHVHESAESLGVPLSRSVFSIDLPLLSPALIAGFVLVFVDVLKELPITMITRPFNYDTLATKAFFMASDERLRESANASLLIVMVSALVLLLLSKKLINGASH
ncbi:MAG TPA: iron ABC transporter permease [Luteibaculaceae bacterium]|nr:iron ABC transporter permease [Luteibaculaceae bacterium]